MDIYPIYTLVNKTMRSVRQTSEHGEDGIEFVTDNGVLWVVMHAQGCCENVTVDDITGDLDDLVGSPIIMAEAASQDGKADCAPQAPREYVESSTWTFFKFATAKGYVTVRFFGESNGYYGESADLFGPENR